MGLSMAALMEICMILCCRRTLSSCDLIATDAAYLSYQQQSLAAETPCAHGLCQQILIRRSEAAQSCTLRTGFSMHCLVESLVSNVKLS